MTLVLKTVSLIIDLSDIIVKNGLHVHGTARVDNVEPGSI